MRLSRSGILTVALLAATPFLCDTSEGDRVTRLVPRPPVLLAWFAEPSTPGFQVRIKASCPNNPLIDAPGVLCEDFDTERNGVAGFQWSRLPIGVDQNDPLRALGDPDDDILGYTQGTGAGPIGTAAMTCPGDVTHPNCQAPVATENDWHLHSPTEGPGDGYDPVGLPGVGAPDGGKAHGGVRSMHMGRHLDPSTTLGDTIRFRQVAAFVLDSQGDPEVPGLVIGETSTLEFWHMISVPDDENFGAGFEGGSFGGAQVQISLLGGNGQFERWRRLQPSFNRFDSLVEGSVSLCSFDPGDDRVAPNDLTLCDPAPVWADLGDVLGIDATCTVDTDGNDPRHRDCGAISSCTGGPGCTENGTLGVGVWARSAFDLSPFSGRVARLRWIGMVEGGWSFGTSRSALEPSPGHLAYQYFDGDDGWWIDDIVLTDLRRAPMPCEGDADGDGFAFCAGDCDDTQAAVYPGAPQICDGLNNDCDDADWPLLGRTEADRDYDGYNICTGDCDETRRSVYPGAPQICDGLNNDCNDPNWPELGSSELDDDMDGYTICQGDCDGTRATVYPGAPQICDGLNNDCNDPGWPALGSTELDLDLDGYTPCQGDCDGTRASVYPGAPQICDGLNNDCSDPAWPAPPPGEADGDGDGYIPCLNDCDDTRATVRPYGPPICDGLNNDCNDPNWPALAGTNETDDDGDMLSECAGDCDDTYASVYPNAPQICDGLNNDCDDPLWPAQLSSDKDADGDGHPTCAGAGPADCNDGSAAVWYTPGEVTDLILIDTLMRWQAPADPGATTIRYDTLRSGIPWNFSTAAVCVLTDSSLRVAEDTQEPAPGETFFYIVRARNYCPPPLDLGTGGSATDGTPRAARTCP